MRAAIYIIVLTFTAGCVTTPPLARPTDPATKQEWGAYFKDQYRVSLTKNRTCKIDPLPENSTDDIKDAYSEARENCRDEQYK